MDTVRPAPPCPPCPPEREPKLHAAGRPAYRRQALKDGTRTLHKALPRGCKRKPEEEGGAEPLNPSSKAGIADRGRRFERTRLVVEDELSGTP